MRFCFIEEHQRVYPVRVMCRVLKVSPSGYYAWRSRPRSRRSREDRRLQVLIRAIHRRSRCSYGAPRIHVELVERGIRCGRHRVARLMRDAGLQGARRRRYRVTTDSHHVLPVAPNRLAQQFTVKRPNQVWLADLTYLPTREGWLYLAAVMDLASRRIVGWATSDRIDQGLVLEALDRALESRCPEPGLLHHSDRGVQGGFNWSLQHLEMEVFNDGSKQSCQSDSSDAWTDVVSGSPFDGASSGPDPVLGGDRSRGVQRGRRKRGWGVAGCRIEMVQASWWNAAYLVGSGVGALSVVRRAGRDRHPSRSACWIT